MKKLQTGTVYYVVTSTEVSNEDNLSYTAYGIAAFCITKEDAVKLDQITDVSTNFHLVHNMAEDFNRYDLHLEHFRDVVYDIICSQ